MAQTETTATPSCCALMLVRIFLCVCVCVCSSFCGARAERVVEEELNLDLNLDLDMRLAAKSPLINTNDELEVGKHPDIKKLSEIMSASERVKNLKDMWEQSLDWAMTAASTCSKANELMLAWFGNDDSATKQHVCNQMKEIVDVLNNLQVEEIACNFPGGDSTMMCVMEPRVGTNTKRYIINVCPGFYKSLRIGSKHSSKYGVLVHEASHHLWTKDEKLQGQAAYGAARSFELARTSTKQALNNADNYKWFAYYLKRNGVKSATGPKEAPCLGSTEVTGPKAPILSVRAKCKGRGQPATRPTEVTAVFFNKANKVIKLPEIPDDSEKETTTVATFSQKEEGALTQITEIKLWYEVAGSYYSGSTAWEKGNGNVNIQTQRIVLKATPPDVLPCQLKFDTKIELPSSKPSKPANYGRKGFPTVMSLSCTAKVTPVMVNSSVHDPRQRTSLSTAEEVKNMELKSGEYFTDFDKKTYTFVGRVGERQLQLSQKVPNALEECRLSFPSPTQQLYIKEVTLTGCTATVKDFTVKDFRVKGCTDITKKSQLTSEGAVARVEKKMGEDCKVELYGYVNGVFGYKDGTVV